MAVPAVELQHVSKVYRESDAKRVVLRDVSVAIRPGEIVIGLPRGRPTGARSGVGVTDFCHSR